MAVGGGCVGVASTDGTVGTVGGGVLVVAGLWVSVWVGVWAAVAVRVGLGVLVDAGLAG